jgi:hypothetical protein
MKNFTIYSAISCVIFLVAGIICARVGAVQPVVISMLALSCISGVESMTFDEKTFRN